MKKLLYPLFGLGVLGAYAGLNVTGVDPFATGTERAMSAPAIRSPAGRAAGGVIYSSRGFRRGK
ncbi:MAG TPA: hypothetical protein RMH85_22220 [Polyangiaceae bacterium LLY-WYZ-15_(1-7)]|nr:hypothetical protein [Myxococcales bacterium]MAT24627.1 hypothetical protein [Sandaracinus sp.]HJK90374.1 hypothetical protein [Polyangiaceae bacterium LLY-WYZ-15_(1-7)]HJL03273.1 hypothetical protein [Polyangiaceae bacterium LLY-WYZ-15_(1-7)]HJL11209.1 hypothetical protein [Polyangiaceae bacterium LLY-WYZ-15_(1-7)]